MPPADFQRPGFLRDHDIPIWIIITGNVRSGREFRRIFEQAIALRELGLADAIRFVTWRGELEQAPGLAEALTEAGISILTIQPPQPHPRVHPLFHGYVYHQRKSLHFALQSLPERSFVLKARTDFAEERFDSMVATLFGNPSCRLEAGIALPALETRLFTYDARPDHFFYWDDIVFSGLREDLFKLNNFDLACDFIQPGHVACAETRLFSPLFLELYPVLRWYFENLDGRLFAQLLQKWLAAPDPLPAPEILTCILAAYFHILSRYLVLPALDRGMNFPISLRTFFTADPSLGIRDFSFPWSSHKLISQCLLDRLCSDEEFADPNLATVVSAMRRMDHDCSSRTAMPAPLADQRAKLAEFATRHGLDPFVSQTTPIPCATEVSPCGAGFLDHVQLPEKRQLTRWQQRKLGARKKVSTWLLDRLL